MKRAAIIAAALGVFLGILSNQGVLQGTWWNLALWGLAGGALGLFIADRKTASRAGLVYGACLLLAFMLSGFGGTTDKLPGFLLLTLVITALGTLCGWIAVSTGSLLRRKLKKS